MARFDEVARAALERVYAAGEAAGAEELRAKAREDIERLADLIVLISSGTDDLDAGQHVHNVAQGAVAESMTILRCLRGLVGGGTARQGNRGHIIGELRIDQVFERFWDAAPAGATLCLSRDETATAAVVKVGTRYVAGLMDGGGLGTLLRDITLELIDQRDTAPHPPAPSPCGGASATEAGEGGNSQGDGDDSQQDAGAPGTATTGTEGDRRE